jgi:Lipid A 3-O-deacylase (PagL)
MGLPSDTTIAHDGHLPAARDGLVTKAELVLTSFVVCAFAPWPSQAEEASSLSIGVRARVGGERVIGEEQSEAFREYDAVASIRLPWDYYHASGWGAGTRLLASAGVLQGGKNTALVVSLIPVLAIGSQDGRFVLDLGAGGALLSRHEFEKQDYGGHFQFALTVGVTVPLYGRFGVGYRFLHYSDAGIHGKDTIGADFHMVEFTYRF